MMSAGTVKFVCVRRSNGRHLCKAMETLRMQRKWKHRTRKHKTLDVDWLINCRSGKPTQQRPWDEDNGSAVICVTAQRFGQHGLKKATQPFPYMTYILQLTMAIGQLPQQFHCCQSGWASEGYIIGVELSWTLTLKSISFLRNLWFQPRRELFWQCEYKIYITFRNCCTFQR